MVTRIFNTGNKAHGKEVWREKVETIKKQMRQLKQIGKQMARSP